MLFDEFLPRSAKAESNSSPVFGPRFFARLTISLKRILDALYANRNSFEPRAMTRPGRIQEQQDERRPIGEA